MTNNNFTRQQDIIDQAKQAIDNSNQAIAVNVAYINELEKNLAHIKLSNEQAQNQIDKETSKIIQSMDDATVKFVNDTE